MNDSATVFLFAKNVDLSVSYATEFCEFFFMAYLSSCHATFRLTDDRQFSLTGTRRPSPLMEVFHA